ncbi:MAG: endopeptidase La, partial [Firmicutes bacterium]|nr:endopeptidase La [Bacillota bacterium]
MAVLPVYNIITVPDSNIYIRTEYYRLMTDKVPATGEMVTMIILKEDLSRRDLKRDSFYPIGLKGFITEVHDEGFIVAHMDYRVDISEVSILPDH